MESTPQLVVPLYLSRRASTLSRTLPSPTASVHLEGQWLEGWHLPAGARRSIGPGSEVGSFATVAACSTLAGAWRCKFRCWQIHEYVAPHLWFTAESTSAYPWTDSNAKSAPDVAVISGKNRGNTVFLDYHGATGCGPIFIKCGQMWAKQVLPSAV